MKLRRRPRRRADRAAGRRAGGGGADAAGDWDRAAPAESPPPRLLRRRRFRRRRQVAGDAGGGGAVAVGRPVRGVVPGALPPALPQPTRPDRPPPAVRRGPGRRWHHLLAASRAVAGVGGAVACAGATCFHPACGTSRLRRSDRRRSRQGPAHPPQRWLRCLRPLRPGAAGPAAGGGAGDDAAVGPTTARRTLFPRFRSQHATRSRTVLPPVSGRWFRLRSGPGPHISRLDVQLILIPA